MSCMLIVSRIFCIHQPLLRHRPCQLLPARDPVGHPPLMVFPTAGFSSAIRDSFLFKSYLDFRLQEFVLLRDVLFFSRTCFLWLSSAAYAFMSVVHRPELLACARPASFAFTSFSFSLAASCAGVDCCTWLEPESTDCVVDSAGCSSLVSDGIWVSESDAAAVDVDGCSLVSAIVCLRPRHAGSCLRTQ